MYKKKSILDIILDIASKWKDRTCLINGDETFISSSFIQQVMKELGKNISNSIEGQIKEGKEVEIKDMILGDCIYLKNDEGINYVSLYIGNNKMIYASSTKGKDVEEDIIPYNNIKTIRRFLDKYKSGEYILHVRTPIRYMDNTCKCLLGDYNGNRIMDLFCLKKGINKISIHVLNGADNFKTFLLQIESALGKFEN